MAAGQDEGDQAHFNDHRIAQTHGGGDDGIEALPRFLWDDPALKELPDDRPDPLVDNKFSRDHEGQCHQEPSVYLHIVEEWYPDSVADCSSFNSRDQQQRQPGDKRNNDYPSSQEIEGRAGELGA